MHKPVDLPSIALGFRSLALAKSALAQTDQIFFEVL